MAQFMLFAGVSIVSALGVVAFYRFTNDARPPAAAPRLAASSTRPVQTVTVTPPAAPDAGASAAASATAPAPAAPVAVAAAAPTLPAPAPRGPAVRGVTDSEIRFGIAAPFSGSAKELGRQMKLGVETAFGESTTRAASTGASFG